MADPSGVEYPPAPAGPGYTAQEMGFPLPQPTPGGMPPGDGGYTTPNFLSFASIVQTAARAYLYTFDEALRDSPSNARAMRRDPVLMGALRRRQRATALLSWTITAKDETDPAQVEAAHQQTEVLNSIPRFQKMKMQLLEAIWYGKFAVEIAWEWRTVKGEQVLHVRDFIPINGDKIRFRWDGVPGFLVYGNYPGTKTSTDYGYAHFVTPEERQQYVIHEHEPDDADWWEPEMGGMIHGVGVRGRLYWFWWLKQQVFGLLMNYLNRFANGLTIFYYQAGNKEAKAEAEAAARAQFSNTALIYPRWPSENPDVNGVQRLEVGTASATLIWNLINEYFDNVMERYIEGQTLSSQADAAGLGSKTAEAHGETLDEIIKYDAVDLSETVQTDLVNVLYQYNAPGVEPGKFAFQVDSPNAGQLMEHAQQLFEMGVPLDEEEVYEISQWSKPKPGNGIVTQLGQMQPAAVGGVQGVPVAGQAGPPGQPQPQQSQVMPQPGQESIPQEYQGVGAPGMGGGMGGGMPFKRTNGVVNRLQRKKVVVSG